MAHIRIIHSVVALGNLVCFICVCESGVSECVCTSLDVCLDTKGGYLLSFYRLPPWLAKTRSFLPWTWSQTDNQLVPFILLSCGSRCMKIPGFLGGCRRLELRSSGLHSDQSFYPLIRPHSPHNPIFNADIFETY